MIREVSIKNFKSISDLKIELGRFNVFIGENGSGKSNVLEAIALGGAASADKLDNEFLTSRGIRVPEPHLMRAAFDKKNLKENIEIDFTIYLLNQLIDGAIKGKKNRTKVVSKKLSYRLQNENSPYSSWYDLETEETKRFLPAITELITTGKTKDTELESVLKEDKEAKKALDAFSVLRGFFKDEPKDEIEKAFGGKGFRSFLEEMIKNDRLDKELAGFIIFSPENTFLRRFEDEEKIQPLGIKGEGLFKLLKVFSSNGQSDLKTIKHYLKVIDWFEDFEVSKKSFEGEKSINIKDRYIDESISLLHQQSANEGFLFLLFYLSLFISKDTPEFFAIDNVEAAFNPKLCTKITKVFNELSEKRKKQVILTTHNPFILDGLDLKDEEQRLFVIRRNADGHTIATRIPHKETKYKLSEAWMLGYLGGLPKNF